MALVGDVILSARELIPDLPQVLPSPVGVPTAAVVAAAGSTLPTGNYIFVITFRTPWGETLPSPESGVLAVGANQGIQITAPSIPPSSSVMRAYLTLAGGAAGTEQQFIESATLPLLISIPPPSAGVPPTRNTAWLADTDGKIFSSGTLYRWLNQALSRLARKSGGLQDYSAIGSVAGQPLYAIPGEWAKITNVWYDGFPLSLGGQGSFFRRNQITSSVLASCAVAIRTNQVVIELFYQPARTAGASTLSAPLAITDTVAAVTSLGGFQSFGPPMFAALSGGGSLGGYGLGGYGGGGYGGGGGVGGGIEIVAFSRISGNQLVGLIRGVGGTAPLAWPAGTTIVELNVPMLGKRLSTQVYVSGNAANLLPVPLGWEQVLPSFLLHKARRAEQDNQAAAELLKEFDDACSDFLRANRQLAGPTQVGGNTYGSDTVPGFGTSMGGVVLP